MISIILPTHRINDDIKQRLEAFQLGLIESEPPKFTEEFHELAIDRLNGVEHYLEPTLKSLESQIYKEFELIISHKYPVDALDIVKKYDIPLKLVSEKHSIWHDLGSKYGTLCNSINTGVIHSKGDLLWRLDDLTFFNKHTLGELQSLYSGNAYATSRAVRCIEYDKDKHPRNKRTRLGLNKIKIEENGWSGEMKMLTPKGWHVKIGRNMCWGFSSTISTEDFLAINGQDEIYDGCVCGTDVDLGNRLMTVSNMSRLTTKNYIYEIDDVPYKYMMRDDMVMRQFFNQTPETGLWHYRANTWKPEPKQLKLYKRWHERNVGILDENWNKFMKVPFIDMLEEHKLKRLGEVIYEN